MALTVTTDLTVITTAETITGWSSIGAQSAAIEPDFFVQGANCVSRAVSGTGTVKGMVFDNGAGIDFTTGTHKDKLVYIWMRVNTAQLADTQANAGVTVRLCTTSATADFREWNVDGKDSIPATDGWICYVVDPQSAGTATTGTYNAASVRFFGGTLKTTTTAKGQNFGIDQIMYGRGELRVSGTVTTAGQGFKEIADVAYDTAGTNRWGIITEKAGVFYMRGKIILGHGITNTTTNWTVAVATNVVTVQTIVPHNMTTNSVFSTNGSWTNNAFMANLSGITVASIPTATSFTFALTQANQGATTETNAAANIGANTTFSSRGETVVWETPSFYNGTNIVKLIPDASVGGTLGSDGKTTYNGIGIIGGSGTTTIDFGVIVGTDGGRSGATLVCALNSDLTTPGRTLATVTVDNSTMALSLYASTFANFEGQIDLTGTGVDDDDCFACTFNGCGRLDSNMEIRNINLLNSVAIATDGAFIWNDTTNLQKGVFAGNSRAVVFEAITGTPFTFTEITFSGNTFDVRNESEGFITINIIDGTTPTVENIGASTTSVVGNPVTVTVTTKDVDGDPVGSANVFLKAASGGSGVLPVASAITLASATDVATATLTSHNLLVGDTVHILGASNATYNGIKTVVTVPTSATFTYAISGSPGADSGTVTFIFLKGLTHATTGILSMSRVVSFDQNVIGWARKSSAEPFYKNAPISGTVSATTGLPATAVLILDQ